jgi:hypothetical protein
MILNERRLRSQHKGVVRDFVIEWYADDEGEIFCRTSHVFVRRVEREPQENAQLRALARRVTAG